ncbi:GAF and ANTAR domain-containing protein [Allobranchiibius sp. CTAmp26]|uniref:GAF and ANTAR domain-containing protein n=1 Tax=Allobranchiibius sp. CTAmp26 TaxID=2815214 RepID=UPI001AA13F13|nr:GAF and ANTAR domain-containing protein [Allobranchiibius sp. CTAmp26]MBO1754538.1 GAF and ANTAR domain-containing protein [Allobranchiibius sp. CTAmp26]
MSGIIEPSTPHERPSTMVTQQRLLQAFVELADTLVADFDVIDFLHTLAATSVELLDADAAGLMLADQRGELHLLAASSEETRTLELFELQHHQGPCLDAYHQGVAVVNVDLDTAEQRWPAFGPAVRAGNFSTVHAIPMRLRDEVIGAMNLFLVRLGKLSEGDIELSQGLADIATIGLLQERAVQQQQVLAEQLQGALNSRVVIEQAKGMLAAHHDVAVPDAFAAMRTYARRTGRPLSNVAIEIIDGTLDQEQLRPS